MSFHEQEELNDTSYDWDAKPTYPWDCEFEDNKYDSEEEDYNDETDIEEIEKSLEEGDKRLLEIVLKDIYERPDIAEDMRSNPEYCDSDLNLIDNYRLFAEENWKELCFTGKNKNATPDVLEKAIDAADKEFCRIYRINPDETPTWSSIFIHEMCSMLYPK